ncbi:MAG: hypothetical protein H8K10_08155 [Nitrospira sp.]|nr:hypothetical protein [Nitrospira sp.]
MRTGDREEGGEGSPEFFGRPVLFRCRFCERVRLAGLLETSRSTWQDESTLLRGHEFSREDPWWFHTCCEYCQPTEHPSECV